MANQYLSHFSVYNSEFCSILYEYNEQPIPCHIILLNEFILTTWLPAHYVGELKIHVLLSTVMDDIYFLLEGWNLNDECIRCFPMFIDREHQRERSDLGLAIEKSDLVRKTEAVSGIRSKRRKSERKSEYRRKRQRRQHGLRMSSRSKPRARRSGGAKEPTESGKSAATLRCETTSSLVSVTGCGCIDERVPGIQGAIIVNTGAPGWMGGHTVGLEGAGRRGEGTRVVAEVPYLGSDVIPITDLNCFKKTYFTNFTSQFE